MGENAGRQIVDFSLSAIPVQKCHQHSKPGSFASVRPRCQTELDISHTDELKYFPYPVKVCLRETVFNVLYLIVRSQSGATHLNIILKAVCFLLLY